MDFCDIIISLFRALIYIIFIKKYNNINFWQFYELFGDFMNCEFITASISTCSLHIYEGKTETTKNVTCEWHLHFEYEMFLLLTGEKYFHINGNIEKLSVGDIIFVNSNIPHKTETPVGSRGILLQFKTTLKNNPLTEYELESIFKTGKSDYIVIKNGTDANKLIKQCMEKICREYENKQKYFEYFIKAYLLELSALLCRNDILTDYNEALERISDFIPVLNYIDKNYLKHISLLEVSKIMNFHTSYFCKKFKETIGVSFLEYLHIVRINKAARLIKETSKNITEISFETGFSSVSYFIKTFKKYNRCTPNKYRELCSKRQ